MNNLNIKVKTFFSECHSLLFRRALRKQDSAYALLNAHTQMGNKCLACVFASTPLTIIATLFISMPILAGPLNIPDNTARETLREQERQRQLHQRLEAQPSKKGVRSCFLPF